MTSTQEIHGHEIIRLVDAANPPLTRAQLAAEVERRFGPRARFCTCSAGGMTLDELLAFLGARGKVVEYRGRMVADISKMCGNEGHEHEHDHD